MTVLDIIKQRWSPRAFTDKPVDNDHLNTLFEAARWAPSSMNEQPWRYFYAKKGEAGFEKMLDCLVSQNRVWAKEAAVLVLSAAQKNFKYNGKNNRHAMHDLGAANYSIAIQATALGMQVHQMGGFIIDKTIETFKLDAEEYEPVSFIALGYEGSPDILPEDLRKREVAPRQRNKREEMVKHFG